MNRELIAPESTRSVLFAMSDVTVAHAFAHILDARNHLTATADSIAMACELADCDVLVAEFGELPEDGPRIDGLALVEHVRAMGLKPYTILVAHRATSDDYRRAIRLGVDDVLERPLLPEELAAAVEESPALTVARSGDDAPTAMHIVLSAEDGAAEAAARDLIGWCARCEVTPPARARVGSAVAEIVQNAVDHGAATVEVVATIDGRKLDVEVVDDGPGFDAVRAQTEAATDASTGLGRAHSLCEEMSLCSEPGSGSRVRLRFGVTALEFDDEDRIDLTDLDYFAPATSKELLATLEEDPDAPVVLSPALAVVVGRLLVGPDPRRTLQSALWS